MREETVVKYIADDGVAFKDKLDCLNYEKLCEKYKKWLADGKVMFWDHYEKYINFDLCKGKEGCSLTSSTSFCIFFLLTSIESFMSKIFH